MGINFRWRPTISPSGSSHQERIFWGRGNASDLRVFETGFGRLGGLICFENHMTLLKAAMAVKGE